MKEMIVFRIKCIPDLTLKRYQSESVGGVDGIFMQHKDFFRQWNRKGVLSGISLHFFYQYAPEKTFGNRLEICLGIRGEKTALVNVKQMMEASLLMTLYPYEIYDISQDYLKNSLFCDEYNKLCTITKKELFMKPSTVEGWEGQEQYYSIAKMETAEDGRLYSLFSLMEKLNLPVLYRVDLYPVDVSERIRDGFHFTITSLEEKKSKSGNLLLSHRASEKRLLDKYEDIIDKIENEPHFICNCLLLGKSEEVQNDNLELLADTIAAESIVEGNYSLSTFHLEQKRNALSFLDEDVFLWSEDRSHCLMANHSKGNLIYHKNAEKISLKYLPVLWTLDEVLPFCRLPIVYDCEEIQIVKETRMVQESEEDGISIGKDSYGRNIRLSYSSLMKHVFIAGASGSGKTYALLEILSRISEKEYEKKEKGDTKNLVNFLVFEPAKKEYRALLNTKEGKEILLLSPHLRSLFPIQINPFEFPKGIILSQHIGVLMKVFGSSFELEKPAYEVLDSAIEHAYIAKGWKIDDCNDGTRAYPTLSDVYKRVEYEVERYEYSTETKGQIKAFTHLRLGGLMKRDSGEIFNVGTSSWTPEEWLEKSVIIELEALAEQDRNFFVLLICALIHETLIATVGSRGDDTGRKLKHVILIDEAHNIIAPESYQSTANDAPDPKISASAFIAKMLAEVRALGEGIIIADQLPSAMAPEVVKNTVSKFSLKMVAAEDRSIMGTAMMASNQQIENLLSFEAGQALYFGDQMKKPIDFRFNKWQGSIKASSDEDLCGRVYQEEWSGEWLKIIWIKYLGNMLEAMLGYESQYNQLESEEKKMKNKLEIVIQRYKEKLKSIRSYWKLEENIGDNSALSEMIKEIIVEIENFRLEKE